VNCKALRIHSIIHSITTDVIFSNEIEKRSIVIRALVSKECNPDLIIGLPTMQCYNLFPLLQNKIMTHNTISDICSSDNDILYSDERIKCLNIINDMGDYHPNLKDINNVELNEIVQNLQKLDFFNAENDDDDIPDESDLAFMSASNQIDTSWKDVTFEGTSDLIHRLRKLCVEYSDVFAYKIRPQSAKVTPLHFEYDLKEWQRSSNRLPSRLISPEKQDSLCKMLDEYLSLGVIQSSTASAWSQVNLVRKPDKGWRFTLDFRGLNKAIVKTGGQIPHITNMLERLGRKHPNIFGSADLTQGYFQMPLSEECRKATAFITYRGLYEWTRVPMGIFPSANYFQHIMQEEILLELLYNICEIYIDDLLVMANSENEFIDVLKIVLQRFRDKSILLNPKKVTLGATATVFVGHLIDTTGLNMTQQRIENTVNIREHSNLKELQSFLGVANYFRDHIKNHSIIVQPMTAMVTDANRIKTKNIIWTEKAKQSFAKTKEMINACPKLYFINLEAKIILCTDASDYAFGAYLFQIVPEGTILVDQPIRFMSKSFTGAQKRWSTIEKEAYAIYFALRSMDHILGGKHFTIRTDHNNLIFLNNAGSKKVLNWKLSIQHLDFEIEHIKGKTI